MQNSGKETVPSLTDTVDQSTNDAVMISNDCYGIWEVKAETPSAGSDKKILEQEVVYQEPDSEMIELKTAKYPAQSIKNATDFSAVSEAKERVLVPRKRRRVALLVALLLVTAIGSAAITALIMKPSQNSAPSKFSLLMICLKCSCPQHLFQLGENASGALVVIVTMSASKKDEVLSVTLSCTDF